MPTRGVTLEIRDRGTAVPGSSHSASSAEQIDAVERPIDPERLREPTGASAQRPLVVDAAVAREPARFSSGSAARSSTAAPWPASARHDVQSSGGCRSSGTRTGVRAVPNIDALRAVGPRTHGWRGRRAHRPRSRRCAPGRRVAVGEPAHEVASDQGRRDDGRRPLEPPAREQRRRSRRDRTGRPTAPSACAAGSRPDRTRPSDRRRSRRRRSRRRGGRACSASRAHRDRPDRSAPRSAGRAGRPARAPRPRPPGPCSPTRRCRGRAPRWPPPPGRCPPRSQPPVSAAISSARSTTCGIGSNPTGVATRTVIAALAPASSSECATLLPSPTIGQDPALRATRGVPRS